MLVLGGRSMTAHLARSVVGLLLVIVAGWAGTAGMAWAATPITGLEPDLHHAGLVVRHGDGRVTYAYVPFEEDAISGIDLLKRSGISHVTISFGGLGEGVCSLEGEGCPAAECRRSVCQGPGANAPFWQYFRQSAPGEWRPLTLGASSTKVRDGDVDGWSWTGHEAGLPAVSLADVARLAGVPLNDEGPGGDLPAIQTVYPPGVAPLAAEEGQGTMVYVVAGGLLMLIGGGAVYATRRRRVGEDAEG